MDKIRKSVRLVLTLSLVLSLVLGVSAAVMADWDEDDGYKMHWPQLPDLENGQVFESSSNVDGFAVMADDFMCTDSGYITDIHVWGGWYEDYVSDDAIFWIGIYSNISEEDPQNEEDYSMPGELLWEREFGTEDYTRRFWASSGDIDYYYPGSEGWVQDPCSDVYQYNFLIDTEDAFYQGDHVIYWLSVVLIYPDDEAWWGWISCLPEDQWNDDGAWFPLDMPFEWQELFYIDCPEGCEPTEDSADLAFVITTTPPPPPVGGELYPVNKLGILAPWLTLAFILALGGGWVAMKRRQAN